MLTKTQIEDLIRYLDEDEDEGPEWFEALEENAQKAVLRDVFCLALRALDPEPSIKEVWRPFAGQDVRILEAAKGLHPDAVDEAATRLARGGLLHLPNDLRRLAEALRG